MPTGKIHLGTIMPILRLFSWLKGVLHGQFHGHVFTNFLAIVTHPRIYSPPTPIVAANDQIEAWLESPSLILLKETEGYWTQFRNIIEAGQIVGGQVHDARIAALCHLHEVKELWTADRDFSRFSGIKVYNPLIK